MAHTKKNYAKVNVWGERVTWSGEGPLMAVIDEMFASVPLDNHEYLLKKLQKTSDLIKATTEKEG